MTDGNSIANIFNKNFYYRPPLAGLLVFLSLLLFIDKLPVISEAARQWLLPSIAVYIIASSFVSFFHQSLVNRELHGRGNQTIDSRHFWIIMAAQAMLVIGLIAYNVWRNVI